MKTAVSIPDDVFEDADRLARQHGHSRSQLYSRALREFVARHDPSSVTSALDAVVAEEPAIDAFIAAPFSTNAWDGCPTATSRSFSEGSTSSWGDEPARAGYDSGARSDRHGRSHRMWDPTFDHKAERSRDR